jgi:hypothetical protein
LEEVHVLFTKPGHYDSHHVEEKMLETDGSSKDAVLQVDELTQKKE